MLKARRDPMKTLLFTLFTAGLAAVFFLSAGPAGE
jgi:hypothetical protein